MIIEMQKEITVDIYAAQLTIFIKEDHPEFIPILQAYAEALEEDTEPVTYIHNTLFESQPQRFVENIILEFKVMGFVEDGLLTDRGYEVLSNQDVFVPQTGIYTIYTVNDPLFPQIILNIEPYNASVKNEVRNNYDSQYKDLPDYIHVIKNHKIQSFGRPSQVIDIKEIDRSGKKVKKKQKAVIYCEFKDGKWEQRLSYNKVTRHVDANSMLDEETAEHILKTVSPNFDPSDYAMGHSINELNNTEITSFTKDYRLNRITFDMLGTYTNIQVKNIKIKPKTVQDAKEWSIKLFVIKYLNSYLVLPAFQKIWSEMNFENSQLAIYNPDASFSEILESPWIRYGSQKYWYLQAPTDVVI